MNAKSKQSHLKKNLRPSLLSTEKNDIIKAQKNKCSRCGKDIRLRNSYFYPKKASKEEKAQIKNFKAVCKDCYMFDVENDS